MELTLFRVQAIGKIPKPVLKRYESDREHVSKALIGERRVYFYEIEDFASAKIYDGLKLGPGHVLDGPAIVQYPGTTVVIASNQRGNVDPYLNVIIAQK